jgi:rhamnosyltransferase
MAVIVTYHPDGGIADRVRSLAGQVAEIAIWDNGSTAAELAPLVPLARDGTVDLIPGAHNVGIASVLNQAFALAADRGFGWVLVLDQDTTPRPNLLAEAGMAYDTFAARRPAVVGSRRHSEAPASPANERGEETAVAISAGAVHAVDVWRQLGGFRSDFFIDYVDVEYCLRARRAGYAVVRTAAPTTVHHIGRPTRHRRLRRSFTTTNHSANRRYYITRNRIAVWRAFARHEPSFVAVDMWAFAKELVKIVSFERDRMTKLRSVASGMADAVRGRTGEQPRSR